MNNKELFISSSDEKRDPDWVKNFVFQLNNLMVIPMKILEFKLNVETDKGKFKSTMIVEECLDEAEWEKLNDARRIGFNSRDGSHRTV